ncbi:MAG: hypothetical protein HY720_10900 [Planctomycetes bacterium]|nr:hypothetical protein [Planctomycetota bacterium]
MKGKILVLKVPRRGRIPRIGRLTLPRQKHGQEVSMESARVARGVSGGGPDPN